jgi:hypothetical protein
MAKRRSEAEDVTARHTERRIAWQIDQWVNQRLAALMNPLADLASMVSRGSSPLPNELRSSTTSELLEVIVIEPAGAGKEMAAAPAAEPGHPDVAVHLHSALVRHVLSDPESRPIIQALTETMVALGGSAVIGSTPSAIGSIPVDSVSWSKSGEWFTLSFALSARPSSRKALIAQ